MAHFRVHPGRKSLITMNRPLFSLSLAVALSASGLNAQSAGDTAVAQPSSPPPVVAATPPNPATAPAVVQTGNGASPANTVPASVTQIVYTPQLPSAAELTNAASAQDLTVERIVQTSNQVIAFYRSANGQTSNVAYQSLPPAATNPAPTPAPAATAPASPAVVVTSPPQTVVYETAPRVIYYDYPSSYYYPRYYPRVYYPPVSFSFGYNYRHSHHSHFGRGHYRHR